MKTDFQIWNYTYLYGHLNKELSLYSSIEFRWKDNASTFYYNHEHVELLAHITPFFDLAPAYRQVWTLSSTPRQWNTEYQPNMNAYFFWNIHHYDFANRSRFAYRIFDTPRLNAWQYRNRLTVLKTIWKKPTEIRLFAQEEIFFQQHVNGLLEGRLAAGTLIMLFKKIMLEMAYRKRYVKIVNHWENDNILVLNLCAFF